MLFLVGPEGHIIKDTTAEYALIQCCLPEQLATDKSLKFTDNAIENQSRHTYWNKGETGNL